MAQRIPSDILPTLIGDKLKLRVEHLENVFKREEGDLLLLQKQMSEIEKHVELCLTRTIDYFAKKEAEASKKADDSGRMNTEPSTARSKLTKSIGKNEEKKGLTKTKTTAILKTVKKPEEKTMNKAKSTANLSPDVSKTRPKTPKPSEKTLVKSSTKADLTPAKKDLNKNHSVKNLNQNSKEDQKTLKRTPTAKPAPIDKTKPGLTKSNTKGDLLKKKDGAKNATTTTTTITSMTSEEKNVNMNHMNHNEIKEKETTIHCDPIEPPHHPNRVENFSGLIGVVTNNNDVLLTKDETLQITDKNEIVANNQPKIDYNEILDDRWTNFAKYYTKWDHINNILLNKTFGKLSVIQLTQEVQKEILENETKIKNLREKTSIDDLNKDIPPFASSRGAVKAVELLNESMYFKVFSDGNFPAEDVYIPFRILFTFAEMTELYTIKDNEEFWKKTCEYFVSSSGGKLGNLISSILQKSEFKNETIYKVNRLVQPHLSKMTPNFYSKLCATTGLVIFLLKDALEYAGVLQEKKTAQSRIYKNLMYNFEQLQNKMDRLKSIQSKYFN